MGAVSPSRRANAFAKALEERELRGAAADQSGGAVPADLPDPGGTEDGAGDEAALLSLAEGLASLPKPALSPEVKAAQRARLVAAMENAFAEDGEDAPASGRDARVDRLRRGAHRAVPLGPMSRLRPRSRLSKGLAAGGLSVGVAAGAFTGAAAASTDALPGDTLYGLKLGMEDLRLGMADDDTGRGGVYLDNASTRLNEARRLMERDRSGPLDEESLEAVRSALFGVRHDAAEGHRLLSRAYESNGELEPIRSLSSFSEVHHTVWSQLRARLPEQLTDIGDEVSSVFDAIEDEVTPFRSLLPPETDGEAPAGDGDDGQGPANGGHTLQPPTRSGGAAREDRRDGGGDPSPSHSRPAEGGGLLDDTNLLEPPSSTGDGPSPGGGGAELPEPDVTIPPLLPDLLPGLGIEDGDGDR